MKKFLAMIITLSFILSSLSLSIAASDTTVGCQHTNLYADGASDPSDTTQPYGLMCSFFGHKNEYVETRREFQHHVRITKPYCDEVTFVVYVCSRCGEYTLEETDRDESYCCS